MWELCRRLILLWCMTVYICIQTQSFLKLSYDILTALKWWYTLMSSTYKGQHGGYWVSVNKKALLIELFAFLEIYTEYMMTNEGEISLTLIIFIQCLHCEKHFRRFREWCSGLWGRACPQVCYSLLSQAVISKASQWNFVP